MSQSEHLHFAPLFRDIAGRAIAFPHMMSTANDAVFPAQTGLLLGRDPTMGLEFIGLAAIPCDGNAVTWTPDGSHPILGFFKIMAGPMGAFPNLTVQGRC